VRTRAEEGGGRPWRTAHAHRCARLLAGSYGEPWHWINSISKNPCAPGYVHEGALPNFIHFFGGYEVDKLNFHKARKRHLCCAERARHSRPRAQRHVPTDILHCNAPLLKEPTPGLWGMERPLKDRQVGPAREQELVPNDSAPAQSAWMLCNIIPRVNAMVREWKTRHCPQGMATTPLDRWTVMHGDLGCGNTPRCWHFASVEYANGTRTHYSLQP
jgi:hypothetical protein